MDPHPPQEGPQELPMATVVESRPAPPPRPRTRPIIRWLLVLLFIGLCGSLLLNVLLATVTGLASIDSGRKVREKFHSCERTARNKVAIITVAGTILEADGFVKDQIDRAADDPNVKAVVLRVNSPGGAITACDYIYHHLCELADDSEIPIVASMGGIAASGGYYVSMAVGDTPNVIFAEPTTWTGSIGVLIPHFDASGLLKDWGIKEDSIASHPLKEMGSFTKPMTEEERQIFQGLVDDGFDRFKTVVQEGRPAFKKDPGMLDKVATGQIFTAQQAEDHGLIDRIGFLEEAIDRAIELAGLKKDNVRVVEYESTPGLADVIFGGGTRSAQMDLAAMLELTAPRAYYLCTWLPAMAGTRRP
jgi:protease-4